MKQTSLALREPRTWGGRRAGAGRKPRSPGRRVPHRTRPFHEARLPVHVTIRVVRGICLREQAVAAVIGTSFRAMVGGRREERFRIVEFTLQSDHVHLLVESLNRLELSNGMRAVSIRLAHAVNRALGRRGRVVQDRFHTHVLATPTEARNARRYVLLNAHKHGAPTHELFRGRDSRSSAPWSAAYRGGAVLTTAPPVSPARTAFLRMAVGFIGGAPAG